MHDQKTLLENRLTRFVAEYLEPALYRATAPVELTAWTVPGEPVPFAEAIGQTYEPFALGTAWGRPWGTTWLHVTGGVPAAWLTAGALPPDTSVELVVDLGFDGNQSGFQAEGLVWTPEGVTVKAISPFNQHVPLDEAAPVDLFLEAAANPNVATTRHVGGMELQQATPYGDPTTAGDEPVYELRRCELGLLDGQVWQLLGEVCDARRADARAAGDAAAAGGDPAGAAADARRARPRRHRRDCRRGSRRAGRRAEPTGVRQRPPPGGRRARAHRLGLALARPRDDPQVRPDVLQRGGAGRCRPRLRLRLLLGAAVRLDRGVLPRAVRSDHRAGGARPVRAGRRHVGGGRHQHAGR